jgi:hypothetical protein
MKVEQLETRPVERPGQRLFVEDGDNVLKVGPPSITHRLMILDTGRVGRRREDVLDDRVVIGRDDHRCGQPFQLTHEVGIRHSARLDYLADLGIDAIWLSPIFPSPMADFGYDVSNYTGVDPLFGTSEDFDRLLAAAHDRGLKLLLDLVPNHSSDRHPWFLESRSSRQNPKRDWYIWRDAASDGGPPNNWISDFGGSAWE